MSTVVKFAVIALTGLVVMSAGDAEARRGGGGGFAGGVSVGARGAPSFGGGLGGGFQRVTVRDHRSPGIGRPIIRDHRTPVIGRPIIRDHRTPGIGRPIWRPPVWRPPVVRPPVVGQPRPPVVRPPWRPPVVRPPVYPFPHPFPPRPHRPHRPHVVIGGGISVAPGCPVRQLRVYSPEFGRYIWVCPVRY